MSDCISHNYLEPGPKPRAGKVMRNGVSKRAYVWAWIDANGREPEKGKVIRHTCGNPACINPDHLVEGTYKENYDDRHHLGEVRSKPPVHQHHPPDTYLKVVALRRQGLSSRAIAAKLGISKSYAHHLIQAALVFPADRDPTAES